MAKSNGSPILIAGGGIGGLAAAYALALKGIPVRVLEQAPEFREIGAGIQLGPNVFRAFERLGLKDAVMADVHVPPAMEMRDALTGQLVTRIPLDTPAFKDRFKQPYAVIHRHDIHGVFLRACQSSNQISLENNRTVSDFEQDDDGVTVTLETGERVRGRALIGCDGMWSKVREKVVGDGKPNVSGHIAYRAVLKRAEVPERPVEPGRRAVGGAAHPPGDLSAAARGDLQSGRRVPLQALRRRLEHRGQCVRPVGAFQGPASRGHAHARAHRDLAYVGAVRPRAGEGLVAGPRGACSATPPIRCCSTLRRAPAWRPRTRSCSPTAWPRTRTILPAAFRAYVQQRYLRTARVQIMARLYGDFYHARGPAAELRNQMLGSRTPEQSYDGIAWLYGGM